MSLKNLGIALAAASLIGVANTPANAVSLNFAGLNGSSSVFEEPLNYYDGGYGSAGSGPGPDYGIVFGSDAIVGGPTPDTNSAMIPGGPGANLLFFLSGTGDVMDVAAGFTTGFSFYYSAPNTPGSVDVYSGVDGSGTLLATLSLSLTQDGSTVPGCLGTDYCPFTPIGVSFSGTAKSVVFSGSANYIAFADITTNSVTPGNIPEPSTWAMLVLGFSGLGFISNRASRKTVALAA